MKRLFALRTTGHHILQDADGNCRYFATKQEARDYRSLITDRTNKYFVTYGIDHKRYKGAK